MSGSKRIKKFARKQTFGRTFAVLGERTFPALFLPPWLNADSAPSHHDRIREPASAFTAPKAQILERPVALAAIDDGLQVSGDWRPPPQGSLAMRFALAISAGDRTFSNMTGMSAGSL